jgi:hypothetical protein
MRRTSPLGLAQAAIVIGTGLGFVLSYSALRRLAAAHGYDGWEAAIWPLAVDFVAVACTSLAMALAERRGGPTGETWAVAAAAATVSLAGNVVSAWGDGIAMAMHGWAAGVYIALWHVYFRTVQGDRSVAAAVTPPAAAPMPSWPTPDVVPTLSPVAAFAAETAVDGTPSTGGHHDPGHDTSDAREPAVVMSAGAAREAVRRLVSRARAAGREVTTEEVERVTGRGYRQARRLLTSVLAEGDAQARPRVVR